MCHAKIVDVQRRIDACGFIGIFSYAGMPYAEAERNMRLFTAQVMPRLKTLDVGAEPDMSAAYAAKAAE